MGANLHKIHKSRTSDFSPNQHSVKFVTSFVLHKMVEYPHIKTIRYPFVQIKIVGFPLKFLLSGPWNQISNVNFPFWYHSMFVRFPLLNGPNLLFSIKPVSYFGLKRYKHEGYTRHKEDIGFICWRSRCIWKQYWFCVPKSDAEHAIFYETCF